MRPSELAPKFATTLSAILILLLRASVPLRVKAVLVVAPLPTTVARVSASAVR